MEEGSRGIITYVYDVNGENSHIVRPDGTVVTWEELRQKYLDKNGEETPPAAEPPCDSAKTDCSQVAQTEARGYLVTRTYDATGNLRRIVGQDGVESEIRDLIGDIQKEDDNEGKGEM